MLPSLTVGKSYITLRSGGTLTIKQGWIFQHMETESVLGSDGHCDTVLTLFID